MENRPTKHNFPPFSKLGNILDIVIIHPLITVDYVTIKKLMFLINIKTLIYNRKLISVNQTVKDSAETSFL